MAVNPIESPAASAAAQDDLIDLGRYINVLAAWWKEILLIAVAAGALAGLAYWFLGMRSPAVYSAAADVAIVRTISELNFDERFTTTAESVTPNNASPRRNALVALAANPALAVEVIAELGDSLPAKQRQPALLAKSIVSSLATPALRSGDSDLIRITATAESPETAALIATAWARAYVRNVNAVFGQAPDELLASMGEEQVQAQAAYDRAQAALETYVSESRIDELSRQIGDKEVVIGGLRRGRNNTFNSLVDSSVGAVATIANNISDAQAQTASEPFAAEQRGKQALIGAYIDAIYQSQAQVFAQQVQRDQGLLAGYYTRWLQITNSLEAAKTLREQVAASEGSASEGSGSDALVLSLLKLQAMTQALDPQAPQQIDMGAAPDVRISASATDENAAAAAPGLMQSTQPVQVQVGATPLQILLDDKTTLSKATLLAEVDALVAALTQRRTELEAQIEHLGAAMVSGEGYAVPSGLLAAEGALAQAIRNQTPVLLGQDVLTNTLAAASRNLTAPAIDIETLAAYYHLDELQALADASVSGLPLDATIASLEEELRQLHSQLEAEEGRLAQLTQERDLARDALATVGNKITELTLSRAAASSEVRFAAPGIPPVLPIQGLSPLIVAAAGALLGLFFGVVVAFVADYMGKRPFLSRRPAATPA